MKRVTKRLLALVIAMIMVLTSVQITAFAADNPTLRVNGSITGADLVDFLKDIVGEKYAYGFKADSPWTIVTNSESVSYSQTSSLLKLPAGTLKIGTKDSLFTSTKDSGKSFDVEYYYNVKFSVEGPTSGAVSVDNNDVTNKTIEVDDGKSVTFSVKEATGDYSLASVDGATKQEDGSYVLEPTENSTVTIKYVEKFATVNVEITTDEERSDLGGTVTINGTAVTDGKSTLISSGQAISIGVQPADGYSEVSRKIISATDNTGNKDAVAKDDEYTVKVSFGKKVLTLKDGQVLRYYDGMDKSTSVKDIFDLVYDSSKNLDIPTGTLDGVKVEYLAGTYELPNETKEIWAVPGSDVDTIMGILGSITNYIPSLKDSIHTFGNQTEETIRVTYDGVSATTTIKLEDNRSAADMSVVTPVTVTYSEDENAMYNDMIAQIDAAISGDTEKTATFTYKIGEDAVTNATLKALAEADPTQEVTVTVGFDGNYDFKPVTETKSVEVSFKDVYYMVPVTVSGGGNGGIVVDDVTYSNGTSVKAYYNSSIKGTVISSNDYRTFVNSNEITGTSFNVGPVTKDTKIEVSYTTGSVIKSTQPANAALTVNGSTESVIEISAESDVTVVVTPDKEYYVESILVVEDDNVIASESAHAGTVASVSFKTAFVSKDYTVSAVVKPAAIPELPGKHTLTWYDGISYDDLSAAIFNEIVDTDSNVSETTAIDKFVKKLVASDVTVEYLAGETLLGQYWNIPGVVIDSASQLLYNTHEFGSSSTEKIRITWAGNDVYTELVLTTNLTLVDNRIETTTTAVDVTATYGTAFTKEDLLEAANVAVTADDTFAWSADDIEFSIAPEEIASLNVGEYALTVAYKGNNDYCDSSVDVTLTIEKADAVVSVNSQTVKYQDIKDTGVNVSDMISVSPDADMIEVAVGISLGANAGTDAAAIAYVNLPQLIDVDALPDWAKTIVKSALDKIGSGMTVSVSKLKSTLEDILSVLEGVQDSVGTVIPIGINTESIESLINMLTYIEDLEGVGELTVKLTMGQDIVVSDSGMYILGGVVADANYNTAANMGYLVITPDGTRVDLAFNIEDDNAIITRSAILSGSYDLGSHVVDDGTLAPEIIADASLRLNNLYIGVDINGNPVVSEEPSAEIGAYTQIAYIKDLGNEMYYATPIIRSYVVVADTVNVYFVDELGNMNNDRQFIYDGTPKAMTAVAFDRNEKQLNSDYITYKYIGIEGDAEGYYSSEAPTHAGAYTVIATYMDPEVSQVGMAIGAMVIKPAESTVTVTDKVHTYDGNTVDVMDMITKSPEDAKIAVITAALKVDGDFSEEGLSAIAGEVNIDFPARVDEVLKDIIPSAYTEEGITVKTFISKIDEINAALAEMDIESEYLNTVKSVLEEMPDNATLTFKEQADVNPSQIGMYLVQAVVFDPDYQAAVDTGILAIVPNVDAGQLKWNYVDANGIITSPVLKDIDLGATAFVEGTESAEYTDKIQYFFYGVDDEGNWVETDDASKLGNGVYTQIAYIPAEEISADMTVIAPIMRVITIAPQNVTVTFVDETGAENDDRIFTYDGTPKEMLVKVTDASGNEITGERLENLTVTYVGADASNGSYRSTVPPTNVGAYTVTATYVEYDANGELLYIGMDLGAMVIEPAAITVDVPYTEVEYDENGHLPEITVTSDVQNAELDKIVIVVDEANNVNIILPSAWNVETKSINVAAGVANIADILAQINDYITNNDLKELLASVNAALDGIKINTLTINGTEPVEVGTYSVTAVAFGKNHAVATDTDTLIIKEKAVDPTPTPGDDEDPTPTPGDDEDPTPTPGDDEDPTPTPGDDEDPTPTPDQNTPTPIPGQTGGTGNNTTGTTTGTTSTTTTTTAVATGDSSMSILWIGVAVMAIAFVNVLTLRRRRTSR